MSNPDKKETTFFKEAFGFTEGMEVEVYLFDPATNQADFIGTLRPDYAHGPELAHDLPRLYERFELQVSVPTLKHLYFGQKDKAPFVIPLQPDGQDNFRGSLETNLFKADAALLLYSPYEQERYILTVEVILNDLAKRESSQVLPEAWRKEKGKKDEADENLPTV